MSILSTGRELGPYLNLHSPAKGRTRVGGWAASENISLLYSITICFPKTVSLFCFVLFQSVVVLSWSHSDVLFLLGFFRWGVDSSDASIFSQYLRSSTSWYLPSFNINFRMSCCCWDQVWVSVRTVFYLVRNRFYTYGPVGGPAMTHPYTYGYPEKPKNLRSLTISRLLSLFFFILLSCTAHPLT